jgi:protein tyrosine/serine phosphatase
MPDRVLRFERCFNFRDLGGYAGLDGRPVQWRRLFRSMTPQYMSESDAVTAARLDISLVVDLRGAAFASSGLVLGADGVRLALSPSSIQRTDAEAERFREAPPEEALPKLLETYGSQFAAGLQAMAERPAANVLFHCRLGKDRTGVFAALLLKLLGVSDEDVVGDYMLTEQYEPFARQLLDEVETDEAVSSREPRVAMEPPSRTAMQAVLERVESQYGEAWGYFMQHGVTSEMLSAFVESRLERR